MRASSNPALQDANALIWRSVSVLIPHSRASAPDFMLLWIPFLMASIDPGSGSEVKDYFAG